MVKEELDVETTTVVTDSEGEVISENSTSDKMNVEVEEKIKIKEKIVEVEKTGYGMGYYGPVYGRV